MHSELLNTKCYSDPIPLKYSHTNAWYYNTTKYKTVYASLVCLHYDVAHKYASLWRFKLRVTCNCTTYIVFGKMHYVSSCRSELRIVCGNIGVINVSSKKKYLNWLLKNVVFTQKNKIYRAKLGHPPIVNSKRKCSCTYVFVKYFSQWCTKNNNIFETLLAA